MDKQERQAQLRGSLLNHARLKGDRDVNGWVTGSMLALAARDGNNQFCPEDEAGALLEDLVELQMLEEQAAVGKGIGTRTLAHRRFRITKYGRDYCWNLVSEVPGVEVL